MLRQEDCHEFKPCLTYRMISTVAWDTEKDLVRTKNKNKNKVMT